MPIDHEDIESKKNMIRARMDQLNIERGRLDALLDKANEISRPVDEVTDPATGARTKVYETPKDPFGDPVSDSDKQKDYDKFLEKYTEYMT